ncbi:hypothetical protein DYD21_10505 [Rhodohalobacter sp. SW132]|uniref:hypothetical protein n=1 Tax=Rhodohalobacter sp. SW132 TaxID=2293433 RepID=UPI000E2883AD|nr:hypothetical protein [Rhodohalobacter sp. SW132]REL33827.1 hypothetical protein DYD21_10505 [Rhodohalobacter sp. SW132]
MKLKSKFEFWIVIAILLLNSVVLLVESGARGNIHLGLIRGYVAIIFVTYFLLSNLKLNRLTLYVYLFLIYLFLLALFSQNPAYSLTMFSRVYITLMMLPIGYYVVNSVRRFEMLNRTYIYILTLICIYIIISNILGIGISTYLEGTFYTGQTNVNIVKDMLILLVAVPVYYTMFIDEKENYASNKYVLLFITITTLLIVVIGFKRGALLALIAGLLTYIYYSPYKIRISKYIVISGLILLITSPIYINVLLDRYEHRRDLIERMGNIQQIAEERTDRVGEFITTVEVVSEDGILSTFFGKDLFDHVGVLPGFGFNRSIHVDYSVYLYGAGLIGLFLYLWLHIMILLENNKYYKHLKDIREIRELKTIIFVVIIMSLLMSISGGWGNITFRTFIMLYLGACLGVMKTIYLNEKSE